MYQGYKTHMIESALLCLQYCVLIFVFDMLLTLPLNHWIVMRRKCLSILFYQKPISLLTGSCWEPHWLMVWKVQNPVALWVIRDIYPNLITHQVIACKLFECTVIECNCRIVCMGGLVLWTREFESLSSAEGHNVRFLPLWIAAGTTGFM